jgi:hypothetical protein
MGARGHLRVAVIYRHPLLGEGIGRMLAAERDLDVTQAPCEDTARTAAAVRGDQDVIVLERDCRISSAEILGASPDTLVIEMSLHPGTTWAYRRQAIPNRPDTILALVRRLRGGHPAVLADEDGGDPSVGTGALSDGADADVAEPLRQHALPARESSAPGSALEADPGATACGGPRAPGAARAPREFAHGAHGA